MNCVKCKLGKLSPVSVSGLLVEGGADRIDLERCFMCGGVWFDAGELDSAIQEEVMDDLSQASTALPQQAGIRRELDEKGAECPKCTAVVLKKMRLRGKVVLDKCPKCNGRWVDGDELARLDSGAEGRREAMSKLKEPREHLQALFGSLFGGR